MNVSADTMADVYVNVGRFKALVEERLGLNLHDDRDQVEKVVRKRLVATACRDYEAYEAFLHGNAEEYRAIAELLTVGETYFFRNGDHFRALADNAFPERFRQTRGRRPLLMLSVGCSSGEEPYTLAMLLREHFADLAPGDVSILGIDLNPAAIRKAKHAHYTQWSLRETAWTMREKYFRSRGQEFELTPEIREMVDFEERNLFEKDARLWRSGSFDIVLCRNVIIYFGAEKLEEAIARLTSALVPGGFLFLGHSESLRGMTDDFDLMHTHNTFYYQKRDPAFPKSPDAAGSWTESIERASIRVEQLTSRPPPPPLPTPEARPSFAPPASDASRASIDLASELYRQERFVDALQILRSLPTTETNEAATQLLMAAILTNQGQLEEAETICRYVLSIDERNAGAHYLTALARERTGDAEGAMRHDEMAAYLDGTFAMPHLHLGMLARHAGDLPKARRELSSAASLLTREDATRILLFGGGFNRETLTQLCRAELKAAGGKI